jgi:hypothetical protein
MEDPLAGTWRRIIVGEDKAWVLFSHGTCVIFTGFTGANLAEEALRIMRAWGPVHAGSSAGDFSVIGLDNDPGWVVTCHHPDVLTYVSPGDLGPDPSELEVGLFGRTQRQADTEELRVIHIEEGQRRD